MKKIGIIAATIILSVLALSKLSYSQVPLLPEVVPAPKMEIKTVDVNKDGKPEVFYYRDGKYIGKIEADTNNDGKTDIKIIRKEGKFVSAEVDTDYNGTLDKKFVKEDEFLRWVNENHPDYNKDLDKQEWIFPAAKF